MASLKNKIPTKLYTFDRRDRLSKINVLVADRDKRTALLVQRILFFFGFRHMDITTSGQEALDFLARRHYHLLITEWNMAPIDGLQLVRAIRAAKNDARVPYDIPIIMLTARADIDSVQVARDAGISEFVTKPFSAKTISMRIIQIIDNPRSFVESRSYVGPDRRRRGEPPPGVPERRLPRGAAPRPGTDDAMVNVLPANTTLKQQLGIVTAADILNEMVVTEAQAELLKAEGDFIIWAKNDIALLEKAYATLKADAGDADAIRELIELAYAIKSQAGIFGYALGTEVASLLIDYLNSHHQFTPDHLMVIGKHIDTIGIVFREKIKESGQAIGADMLQSLKKLIQKLG